MSAIAAGGRHRRSEGRLLRPDAARSKVVADRAELRSLREDAVVERARTEPDAFGELYDRHAALVYGFIAQRVPDRSTAQDLAAEVFITALRNIGRDEMRGRPFSPWLLRIAANTLADHHRLGRHACLPLDTARELNWADDGVDELVAQRDEVSRVWEAVATLPTHQRLALTLRLRDAWGRPSSRSRCWSIAGCARCAGASPTTDRPPCLERRDDPRSEPRRRRCVRASPHRRRAPHVLLFRLEHTLSEDPLMEYVKLYTTFHDHRKVIELDPTAGFLWVLCFSWSGQRETDGFIPTDRPALHGGGDR